MYGEAVKHVAQILAFPSLPQAPDVKPELDMAAWANVGVKADADQAAAGTAGAGTAGDEGEGDAVWADFAQKAAQEEQRKEQAAEAEAQVSQNDVCMVPSSLATVHPELSSSHLEACVDGMEAMLCCASAKQC